MFPKPGQGMASLPTHAGLFVLGPMIGLPAPSCVFHAARRSESTHPRGEFGPHHAETLLTSRPDFHTRTIASGDVRIDRSASGSFRTARMSASYPDRS